MIESGLEAIIIKTACAGLLERHLSHPINSEFFEIMKELQTKYGAHVCGEGGEYESLVLYCPKIYRKRIIIKKSAHHLVQPDKVAPVQFMEVMEIELQKPTFARLDF
ncbi:Diphthine--ammonia ligase [Thelohanellus kitauei]|uniref:Diphthine--ammonia ligase n=1 Tax=Thelohanellus kitauei TaxID=669202 RepID=A0A0C2N4B8_THEKT|nr:Diphthine--ammonia ligase [Thelohanellus kitauei]